jgi:hypothetical protein
VLAAVFSVDAASLIGVAATVAGDAVVVLLTMWLLALLSTWMHLLLFYLCRCRPAERIRCCAFRCGACLAALHASAFPDRQASSDLTSPAARKVLAKRLPALHLTRVCALPTLKRYSGKLRRTAKSRRARISQREHHKDTLTARTKRGRRDFAAAAALSSELQIRASASAPLRRSRSSFSLSFAVFFKCITDADAAAPTVRAIASGIIRRHPMLVSALVALLLLAALVRLCRACVARGVGVGLPAWSYSHASSLLLAAAGVLSVTGGCSSLRTHAERMPRVGCSARTVALPILLGIVRIVAYTYLEAGALA